MYRESKDLEQFMYYCEELKVLRREIFGRDVMDRRCLENKIGSSCKVDIRNLRNFVSVGMRHREGFLSQCYFQKCLSLLLCFMRFVVFVLSMAHGDFVRNISMSILNGHNKLNFLEFKRTNIEFHEAICNLFIVKSQSIFKKQININLS